MIARLISAVVLLVMLAFLVGFATPAPVTDNGPPVEVVSVVEANVPAAEVSSVADLDARIASDARVANYILVSDPQTAGRGCLRTAGQDGRMYRAREGFRNVSALGTKLQTHQVLAAGSQHRAIRSRV